MNQNQDTTSNWATPDNVGYDEYANGGVREHWLSVAGLLDDSERAASLNRTVRSLLRESDVSSTDDATARPWALDSLPFMLDPKEWRALEAGLTQRARLLNAIVADFYGAGNLLQGKLPVSLAFANPNYLLPSCDYSVPDSTYLTLLAFDLGRSPDGQWRVLSNRTEAPSGLGYALENRMTMSRSVPELFESGSIARLAHFFREKTNHLRALAGQTGTGDELAVILSAGPDQSTYFEQAFLGRYLGIPIVEGADLTVRDSHVYLKTLEGLKPVSLIMRQIESSQCDPLELQANCMLGSPGLLSAARSSNVMVANAIGSGVVENDAIMSFLPGLSESLLGEELLLPSLATWWCGQPDALEEVLGRSGSLVLRDAFARKPLLESSVDAYMQSDLAYSELDLEARIREAPYAFVGREPITLSQVPYWRDEGGWGSAPMVLRLFVGATEHGYQVLPGGLARISTPQGDRSKDVWLALDRVDTRTSLPQSPQPARRSDRDLPSRTADNLFWLGRYLERTEVAVRLYRSLFRNIRGEGEISDQPLTLPILTRLLAAMDYMSNQRARRLANEGRAAVERELWNILFDPEGMDGLARVLANLHRTAEHLRARLSRDTWRLFEGLTAVPQLRWQVHNTADVSRLLDDLIEKLSAVNGQVHENMTRGYGWRLLDSGRRLERSRFVIRVVRDLCTREPQERGTLSLLLDICDSGITHRTRYQAAPTVNTVLDLLLVDNSNPRSVIHQIDSLKRHFETMPKSEEEDGLSEADRLLLATQSELILAEIDKLTSVVSKNGVRTHLNRMLKRVDENLVRLQDVITQTYFQHTLEDPQSYHRR